MKLTKAQTELLNNLESFDGSMTVSDTYQPARKLVELGYAQMQTMRFGGHLLTLTDAGRQALASKGGER